jgi:hypothetical protein
VKLGEAQRSWGRENREHELESLTKDEVMRHGEAWRGVARPGEARNTSTRSGFLFFRFTRSVMGLNVVGFGLWFCR